MSSFFLHFEPDIATAEGVIAQSTLCYILNDSTFSL